MFLALVLCRSLKSLNRSSPKEVTEPSRRLPGEHWGCVYRSYKALLVISRRSRG